LGIFGLVLHNVTNRPLRLAFASLAIAIGVMTAVTFNIVSSSLRESDLAIMQTGRAEFTIAQKGMADILRSSVDQNTLDRIRHTPGVAAATGVLIGTTRLDAANPLFLEIGIQPQDLAGFGVSVVSGRPFTAGSEHELLLGYRAAANLHKRAGDELAVDGTAMRVVGLYSTGQALGDGGAMFPLGPFQAAQRQSGELTLVFVRAATGTDVAALRARIERQYPQLVTVRTVADFGRADRSLALINAADRGSTILAVLVGAVVVMTTMTMTFIERTREFGVLTAIGWPGRRIVAMVVGEALTMGLIGAAGGVAFSFVATEIIGQLPSLVGVLEPRYTAGAFWRALYTAAAMSLIGGLYPAGRAARLAPLEALRHE
jgi:putative ABC transport system permease protein